MYSCHFFGRNISNFLKSGQGLTLGSVHQKIKYFGRLFNLFNCLSKGKQSKGRVGKTNVKHRELNNVVQKFLATKK